MEFPPSNQFTFPGRQGRGEGEEIAQVRQQSRRKNIQNSQKIDFEACYFLFQSVSVLIYTLNIQKCRKQSHTEMGFDAHVNRAFVTGCTRGGCGPAGDDWPAGQS